MFLKYRIMKKLEFGKFTLIETILSWFPDKKAPRVGKAIDMLGKLGFIEHNNECTAVSPRTLSSFQDFLAYQRKIIFEYTVGISAVFIAIEAILSSIQILLNLFQQ